MSTHTSDSRKRRATPRQIARAVRRGTAIPANPRPRPPMPHLSPMPAHARTALSVEPVEEPIETGGPADEPAHRWGQALFIQQGIERARTDGSGWMATLRDRLPRRSPYSWRERDWRAGLWARRARALPVIAAVLVAMIVVGAFAFVIATRAANGAATRLHSVSIGGTMAPSSSSGGVILQQPSAGAPTPAAPAYTIGTWVTDYAPGAGGTEQVYVRVSKNDNPAKNVAVSLSITWSSSASSYGPVFTDAYGLASFKVSVSGPPGQPEFVTASASVGGSSVSANTTFVPAG